MTIPDPAQDRLPRFSPVVDHRECWSEACCQARADMDADTQGDYLRLADVAARLASTPARAAAPVDLRKMDTPENREFWAFIDRARGEWEAVKPDWLRRQEADARGAKSQNEQAWEDLAADGGLPEVSELHAAAHAEQKKAIAELEYFVGWIRQEGLHGAADRLRWLLDAYAAARVEGPTPLCDIQRYAPENVGRVMKQTAWGEWVKLADHQAVLTTVTEAQARLQQEKDELRSDFDSFQAHHRATERRLKALAQENAWHLQRRLALGMRLGQLLGPDYDGEAIDQCVATLLARAEQAEQRLAALAHEPKP